MTYDLIVIGAGPAGMAAAIYGARYKMNTLIIGEAVGGMLNEAHLVENYPGFKSIAGEELMQKMREHTEYFKVPLIQSAVMGAKKTADNIFEVKTNKGEIYQSKALVLASGGKKKKLGAKGEAEFLGRGVSYCATCDGFFFKNKIVAVVGGNDAAVTTALHLADIAAKVYIVYRKECLRCEPIWLEKVKENKKIEIIYQSNIIEIKGESKVTEVILDKEYQGSNSVKLDGVFIEIGATPATEIAKSLGAEITENHIKINTDCSTSVAGLYAAGDVTTGLFELKQAIVAAAEGAVAASSANKYIRAGK